MTEKEKCFIIAGYTKQDNVEYNLQEITELAGSSGLEIVGKMYQMIDKPDVKTFIGSGKVLELKEAVEQTGASLVIVDNLLSGSQIKNIEDEIDARVIDRNMLILDIFASRAQSQEGKLQVKLAQLKYTLPRLAGISGSNGRFGSGGVGSRGPGETKLELDKRKIQREIESIEKDLDKIVRARDIQSIRRRSNVFNVAIVGYTNAGKSTLINNITKADAYADDRLFATLDVLSRKVWDDGVSYVLTDTVGFVSRLPHELMKAFNATLDEARDADLVLIVYDVADDLWYSKLQVVEQVLTELNVDKNKWYYVANKIDIAPQEYLSSSRELLGDNLVMISASKNANVYELKERIKQRLKSIQD